MSDNDETRGSASTGNVIIKAAVGETGRYTHTYMLSFVTAGGESERAQGLHPGLAADWAPPSTFETLNSSQVNWPYPPNEKRINKEPKGKGKGQRAKVDQGKSF